MARESRTLLVVDSSAASLFYWGMLLKRLEYMVMPMRNGEAALRAMEGVVPAMVVTDRVLSGMSGEDLVRKMKEDARLKHVPVVMLSSQDDAEAREACRRVGCDAWFPKTVEPEVLYETLQNLSESTPRRNIRLNTSLKVIVGDGSVVGGTQRTEYAAAISEGGLYIRTRYPQPQNAITPIRLFLDTGEIRAKAVVLYAYSQNEGPYGDAGMGIKFVEISDSDRDAIRQFIKEQLTKDISR
jgi:two-component system chemotaxis response regulator CheY